MKKSIFEDVEMMLESSIERSSGFKPRASSFNNEKGNLVSQGVPRLWRKHFYTLVRADYDINTTFRDDVPNVVNDDGMDILPPRQEEVKNAMMQLKNNKAAGPDDLFEQFKTGVD